MDTKAVDTLYHDDMLSVAVSDPMREIRGIHGVRGTATWWFSAPRNTTASRLTARLHPVTRW